MNLKAKILDLYVRYHVWQGKSIVHFIHIGKTAGTAIKSSFSKKATVSGNIFVSGNHVFLLHGHGFKLADAGKHESVFFVVRDPIQRFISGFYSRKRMGRPLNYNPWNEGEKVAFETFDTANQLAIALSAPDVETRAKAEQAMKTIGHVKSSYWDWFGSREYLEKNLYKITAVLVQENLTADFSKFKEKLNLTIADLPKDKVQSHKNPESVDKHLSQDAIANLKKWYNSDYAFLHFLYSKGLIDTSY